MIKLQDFAKQQGVTDRAIQKHLKNYAAELEGLYERKGPNGTWLTEEACEFLKGKMKQQPMAVFDKDPRLEELQYRVKELEQLLSEKDKMLTLSQKATQEAQDKVNLMLDEVKKVKALEEGKEVLEGKIEALKSENEKMKNATFWQRLRGFKE